MLFERMASELDDRIRTPYLKRAALNYIRAGGRSLEGSDLELARHSFEQALSIVPTELSARAGLSDIEARTKRISQEEKILKGSAHFELEVDIPEPEPTVIALIRFAAQTPGISDAISPSSRKSLTALVADLSEYPRTKSPLISGFCRPLILNKQRPSEDKWISEGSINTLAPIAARMIGVPSSAVHLGSDLILTDGLLQWDRWQSHSWTAAQDPNHFAEAFFLSTEEQGPPGDPGPWYRMQGLRSDRPSNEVARVGIYSPPISFHFGELYAVDVIYCTEALASGTAGIYLQGVPRFVAQQYGRDLPPTNGNWMRLVLLGRVDTLPPSGRLLLYSSAVGVVKWRYVAIHELFVDWNLATTHAQFPMAYFVLFDYFELRAYSRKS
jgi:hypothetical protein